MYTMNLTLFSFDEIFWSKFIYQILRVHVHKNKAKISFENVAQATIIYNQNDFYDSGYSDHIFSFRLMHTRSFRRQYTFKRKGRWSDRCEIRIDQIQIS